MMPVPLIVSVVAIFRPSCGPGPLRPTTESLARLRLCASKPLSTSSHRAAPVLTLVPPPPFVPRAVESRMSRTPAATVVVPV